MNEKRLKAYVDLIQALLACPNGKEAAILQERAELIDPALIKLMEEVARSMADEGNQNAAEFLENLAAQLAMMIASREKYLRFLLEVLQATSDSEATSEVVYPLLEANREKLDDGFLASLQAWATHSLAEASEEEAINIAEILFNFSKLIQEFYLEVDIKLDIAITGYQLVLSIFTRSRFPVDWATTQNNLGTAYFSRIRGEKAQNLEQAIECYQQALLERTRESFPAQWATTQNNLGIAYRNRLRGEKAQNLEQAIKCYQQALLERTRSRFPVDWATTQYNLGIAYSNRIRGEKAQNLEQAIECYQQALLESTRESFPVEWATTQNNLGIAYKNRLRGEKAQNLEQAIECYQQALLELTRESFPVQWAMTLNNLGIAYSDRLRGEKAQNLEQATECFQQALLERTGESFPQVNETEVAINEERLKAYLDLIQALLACPNGKEAAILQERAELIDPDLIKLMKEVARAMAYEGNQGAAEFLENVAAQLAMMIGSSKSTTSMIGSSKSTTSHEEYLRFLLEVLQATSDSKANPKVVYPLLEANREKLDDGFIASLRAWATQTLAEVSEKKARNIALDLFNFSNLIQQFSLGVDINLDIAITGYQLVLNIVTRESFPVLWAMTQISLGIAYSERIRGEKAQNLEQAIECYQQALLELTRESFPVEWAKTQYNLGNAYSERIRGEKAQNLEQAIECYQQALLELTRESFSAQWATTQISLGATYSERIRGEKAQNLEQAIKCYQQALLEYTRESFPVEWAKTQYNLGNAYSERIRGEKAQNLEQAIKCYQQALLERTRSRFPVDWATTQISLGAAYSDRIRGEKAQNLEQAIECFQQSLLELTREIFPVRWAATQNILGTAYSKRIRGEKAQNLEQAIECYQQALLERTRESFPAQWAGTQNDLGNAYSDRIRGEKAQNLEQAIECFQQALLEYTRFRFPVDWAMTQNKLGIAYLYRIRGEKAQNLEQAIECFQQALLEYTRFRFPVQWAMTQNDLGIAYCERIRGEKAHNLEQAIECFQQALLEYTRESFPVDWATTQNNLGTAYSERIRGEKAQNLEQAIKCFQQALLEYTRSRFPVQWAMTQYNLGNAYSERIRGEKAQNLEQAIEYYQQALLERTRSRFPVEWAEAQNNLGLAYKNRIRGEKALNLEQAIEYYQQALLEYTRSRFPVEWADTQNNLGNAYSERIRGEKAQNLEQAIEYYQQALLEHTRSRFPVQWAMTQNNLGTAYRERIRGEKAHNLEQAIECLQQALLEYTRSRFPVQWAMTQNNLGLAYRDRIRGEKAQNLEQAIEYFQQALLERTRDGFPQNHAETAFCLGLAYQDNRQFDRAYTSLKSAIDTIRTISSQFVGDDEIKQKRAEEWNALYQHLVEVCVHLGKYAEAIEYAEESRSKRLLDLMATNDYYRHGEIPDEIQQYLEKFDNLQGQIDALYRQQNPDNNQKLSGADAHLRRQVSEACQAEIYRLQAEQQTFWEAIRRRDPITAAGKQISPIKFQELRQLLDNSATTAILSFFTTRSDTYVFILRCDRVTCHTCPEQGFGNLQVWIFERWLNLYASNRQEWQQQMNDLLVELAQRLQLDRLISEHLNGIQEIILVPHLYLHQIPFAALPLADGGYFGDKFILRYTPSCQVLQFCHNREPIPTPLNFGIVQGASNDVPYARFQGKEITQMHRIPDEQILDPSQATVENYWRLAHLVNVLHSYHHASADLMNALNSALELADGSVTLRELLTPKWRLSQLEEVFLSCCETGLGLTQNLNDEIFTLAGGFLCAGARSVINTLWSVEQLSAALICIFYYEEREKKHSRPLALQKAQQKLRQLTGKELAEMLQQKYQPTYADFRAAKEQQKRYAKDTDEYQRWDKRCRELNKVLSSIHEAKRFAGTLPLASQPFDRPYFWAGFTCQGLS